MKHSITLLICCLAIFACKNKEQTPAPPAAAGADSAKSFLPVSDFLKNDMRLVDSFASGIMRKVTVNGKKDSTYVKLPDFHKMAAQFLLSELDSAQFQNNFRETSLMDETSGLIQFIYAAKDPQLPLRQVVVYIEPSLTNDQVDRVYMDTQFTRGDTLVDQKLSWKMRKYFYVLTIKQPKGSAPLTTMEKLIWDPQHFGDE